MEMIKPQEAARLLNVSYPTLKQWIYRGKLHSIKTPGGHHRIPRAEVERLSGIAGSRTRKPAGLHAISGRNKLLGVVTPDTTPLADVAKNRKAAAVLVDKVGFDN